MAEAPVESPASLVFISLRGSGLEQFAIGRSGPAHIRSPLTNAWQEVCSRSSLALANSRVGGPASQSGIGNGFALLSIERGGSHWNPHGLRSQPVRSACFRAQKPARDIRCLASVCRSFTFGPLDRRAIMSIANTLPGELHGRIISSIINLVCPQCGGRMSEFQCEGRCCRNWLAEWEWANHVTRSSKFRVSGHRAKPLR
jgi:hypothetical protein